MLESLSYLALQQYCWIIVSFFGGLLALSMFVQGAQALIYTVGKTEEERDLIVKSIGRKWLYTFAALFVFGVAFLVSFPLFFAVSFGALYWVILFCFVIQTVSHEFLFKKNNFKGYKYFLMFGGIAGAVIVGTVIGTFFNGAFFSIKEANMTPYRGFEAILNPHNLLLGISLYLLARVLALLYFINNIRNEQIVTRSKIRLFSNAIALVVCFFSFLVWLMLKNGFSYDAATKTVSMDAYKYFYNLLAMPLVFGLLLAGIGLLFFGIARSLIDSRFTDGIWYSGAGAKLTVFSFWLIAGLNHTCYYPSLYDIQDSLTIENSSSTYQALKSVSYVSLATPFALAFIFWKRKGAYGLNKNPLNIFDKVKPL